MLQSFQFGVFAIIAGQCSDRKPASSLPFPDPVRWFGAPRSLNNSSGVHQSRALLLTRRGLMVRLRYGAEGGMAKGVVVWINRGVMDARKDIFGTGSRRGEQQLHG